MESNRMQGYFRRIFSDQQKRIRKKRAQSTVLLPFLGSAHALTVGMNILRALPGTSRLPDAACSIFPDFARLRFPDSGYQRGDEVCIWSRQEQAILTRFWSGHLRTLTSKDGNKVFPTCVRCSACQTSPEHILDCLGLSKQDFYEDPLMVSDFFASE
ncbi:uncharacterized protein TNCV_523991 [Trichonephila clavipes]|nr:uncharacterized protein TNCV_523991 [Trichonephila clavipes]